VIPIETVQEILFVINETLVMKSRDAPSLLRKEPPLVMALIFALTVVVWETKFAYGCIGGRDIAGRKRAESINGVWLIPRTVHVITGWRPEAVDRMKFTRIGAVEAAVKFLKLCTNPVENS